MSEIQAVTVEVVHKDVVQVLEQEISGLEEEDVRPENIPLPTDSMITVRLSDAQLLAETEDAEHFSEEGTSVLDRQDINTSMEISTSRPSSRSSSRSEPMSSTSNSVDWEGLEKTEEQELKDDATDEVRSCYLRCCA